MCESGMNRSNNTRCVVLVYRRPQGRVERFLQLVSQCGEFTHCETFCPDLTFEGLSGCTFTNFSSCEMLQTRECMRLYTHRKTRHLYAMHRLTLTSTEFSLFEHWNKAHVANHCAYNYADLGLQLIPGVISRSLVHDVDHETSMKIPRLYCAQAVVLALRYALSEDHPVFCALAHLNTRLSTPVSVALSLKPLIGEPKNM
jgi:hypothetical protein